VIRKVEDPTTFIEIKVQSRSEKAHDLMIEEQERRKKEANEQRTRT
jgi:hypothetical protein